MIENIQIINKNGDGMFVEGISYVEVTTVGKTYLFYTLNEKVDNDLTKIYIAETSQTAGEAQPIEQEQWDALRKLMVKISHKEPIEDVKFLSMSNVVFHVGDAKKLAVTSVAKQSFKDAQITNTLPTNDANESVVTGTTAFFSQDAAPTESVQAVDNTQSIFDNPIQPVASTPLEQTPVEQTVLTAVPAAAAPIPVAPQPVAEQPVIATPVAESPVVATPVVENPVIVDNIPTNENGEVIISDEEALKAINIIQEYINQES